MQFARAVGPSTSSLIRVSSASTSWALLAA
jgi:hypothetical protein